VSAPSAGDRLDQEVHERLRRSSFACSAVDTNATRKEVRVTIDYLRSL
jgi:hypothetical protein